MEELAARNGEIIQFIVAPKIDMCTLLNMMIVNRTFNKLIDF